MSTWCRHVLAGLGRVLAGLAQDRRKELGCSKALGCRCCARGSRDGSSGWQSGRQRGALWSTGLRQGLEGCAAAMGRMLEGLGSPGTASRQAGSEQALRHGAAAGRLALRLGAAGC